MKVGILGYGITPFTRDDQGIESMLLHCTKNLFDNSPGITQNSVDAVLISTNENSKYLASVLSEMSGIQPKIAHTVESMCNSGSNAIVSAYSYIASGLAETVLVCGADKYNGPGQILQWDDSRGEYKHPIFWASIFTKSYKRQYGITDEQLASVPVKNHKQAQKNPNALPSRTCTVGDVMQSRKLTGDLRLFDCSRPCTGAASVLLGSEDALQKFTGIKPVWITGIGQQSQSAGFAKNTSFSSMESTRQAGRSALRMSGNSISDVDVAEVHDAFSVCEVMALESLGFCHAGGGSNIVQELHETDNFKINPRGGLIGSGHPLGATGVAQTVEIAQQLSMQAGNRQIKDARVGLVHNMSAAATSSTVLVLER